MASFGLPGDCLNNQLHSLESLLLLRIITIPHTNKPVAILGEQLLGASLAWI
jgi:hypothetical protein